MRSNFRPARATEHFASLRRRENVPRDHMVAEGAGHYFLAGFLKGGTGREGGREEAAGGTAEGKRDARVGKGETRAHHEIARKLLGSLAFRFSGIIL